jgi:hypothetical protein
MPSTEKPNTHHRAVTLNLDTSTFGSFAEIGAGQEVARWFLVVGGASGTVAKTISAYDKEVSDDLYGSGSHYVSKQRLEAMLDNEWAQLLTQNLDHKFSESKGLVTSGIMLDPETGRLRQRASRHDWFFSSGTRTKLTRALQSANSPGYPD